MIVPIKWLKEYVDIDIEVSKFADGMTMSGSMVESINNTGAQINGVVVGKIESIEKHPDADRLLVTQVNVGDEVVQIVTGAQNINVGDYIPVALSGATLPGDVKIKKGKLRGIESNGMMCSAEELGMDLENISTELLDGIYILKEEYPLGKDVKEILGLDDAIIEFEITNNRPDCLSVIGIAREAAATFSKNLKYPDISFSENDENTIDYVDVEVLNGDLCKRFATRAIKNVKVKESPAWMQEKLIKSGIRPINNIVDITNYVMLEFGQPMHAYDYSKINGKKIIVRNANEGETIKTLDNIDRKLDKSMLVISDTDSILGIAGIMGGDSSGIDDTTDTVILECANFESVNIRLSSKALGLRTDASSRFEKGLDMAMINSAIDRACHLIEKLDIGEIVGKPIDIYPNIKQVRAQKLNTNRVRGFLGIDISNDMIVEYLKRLEFNVTNEEDELLISIPTFRDDIEIEADLMEEIARIYGYDNIPCVLMNGTITQGGKTLRQKVTDITKNALTSQGLFEVCTYSFVSPNVFNKINLNVESAYRKTIKILNPLGEDQSIMRTTIIPNIMEIVSRNINRNVAEGAFFELSKIYMSESLPLVDLADEKEVLTIGMYGNVDFYNLKGIIENLLEELNIVRYRILPSNHDSFHPGRTAELLINNKRIGYLGEIHPDVADNYGISQRVYICELNFDEISEQSQKFTQYKSLPKYPSVERDIAIVVSDDITAAQIEEIIKNKGGKLVEEVKLFDVYRGSQIEQGYKSMAYSIVYRSEEKTLTEEDILKVHNKILSSLENQIGASLRR